MFCIMLFANRIEREEIKYLISDSLESELEKSRNFTNLETDPK